MNLLTLTSRISNFYNVTYKSTYLSTLFGLAYKGYGSDPSSFETSGSNYTNTDFSDISNQSYSHTKAYLSATAPKIPPKPTPVQVIEVDLTPIIEPTTPDIPVVSEGSPWFMDSFLNSKALSDFIERLFSFSEGIGSFYPFKIVMWPIELLNGMQNAFFGNSSSVISFVLSGLLLIGVACMCLSPRVSINTFADLIRLGISTAFKTVWIGTKGMALSVWNVTSMLFGKIWTSITGYATKIHEFLLQYTFYTMISTAFAYGFKTIGYIKSAFAGVFTGLVYVSSAFYWWIKYLVNGSSGDHPFFDRFCDIGLFMKSWLNGRSSLTEVEQAKLDSVLEVLRGHGSCLITYEELSDRSLISEEEKELYLRRGMQKVITELDLALAELETPTVEAVRREVATSEILLHRVHYFLTNLHSRNFRDYQEFSCQTRLALGYDAVWLQQSQRRLNELALIREPLTLEQTLELVNIANDNKTVLEQLVAGNKVIEVLIKDFRVPLEVRNCLPGVDSVVLRYLTDVNRTTFSEIMSDASNASRDSSPQSTDSTEVPQSQDVTGVPLQENVASGSSSPSSPPVSLFRGSPETPVALGNSDSEITVGDITPNAPYLYERFTASDSDYATLLGPATGEVVEEGLASITDNPLLASYLRSVKTLVTRYLPVPIDRDGAYVYFRNLLGNALPPSTLAQFPENPSDLYVITTEPVHPSDIPYVPVLQPPQALLGLMRENGAQPGFVPMMANDEASGSSSSNVQPLETRPQSFFVNKQTGHAIDMGQLTPEMFRCMGSLARTIFRR